MKELRDSTSVENRQPGLRDLEAHHKYVSMVVSLQLLSMKWSLCEEGQRGNGKNIYGTKRSLLLGQVGRYLAFDVGSW